MNYKHSYLAKIQFLGFRLHGWQKQPKVKTVHFVLDKTLKFVLGSETRFKSIGVGRTDAKVSSNEYSFQLFCDNELDKDEFLTSFNKNSPSDIRILDIHQIKDESFNIIQHPKIKEYHYYFSNEGKNHPYAAAFMTGYEGLDIDLMSVGANMFVGTHHFEKYCSKPTEHTKFKRTIESCSIEENTIFSASFFPETSYVLKVRGEGFLRYQIRFMMAMLVELGINAISLEEFRDTFKEGNDKKPLHVIAPGSGLHLYMIDFKNINDILI